MEELIYSFKIQSLLFISFALSGVILFVFSLWTYKREKLLPSNAEINSARDEVEEKKCEVAKLKLQIKEYNEIKAHINELEKQKNTLEINLKELYSRTVEFESKSQELSKISNEYNKLQAELPLLKNEKDECQKLISQNDLIQEKLKQNFDLNKKLENELNQIQSKYNNIKIDYQNHKNETEVLERNLITLKKENSSSEKKQAILNAENESLLQQIERLNAELENLGDKFIYYSEKANQLEGRLPELQKSESQFIQSIDSKKSLLAEIEKKLKKIEDDFTEKNRIIKNFKSELNLLNNEKTSTEKEIEILKNSKEDLKKSIDQLSKQFEILSQDTNQLEAKPEKILADFASPILNTNWTMSKAVKEEDALIQVKSVLKHSNLKFEDRQIHAFHTALKSNMTSPLCILAGISGVGKSILPRKYAEAMGIHFLNLPVQPRWDSPQDLIGFYNYLEKRYKATELIRALAQMDPLNAPTWNELIPGFAKQNISNQMLLVLIDEMNIARVEYYFSEFLSRLEMRREITQNNVESRKAAELILELGPTLKDKAPRIFVGSNVMFVGTMNEDESTLTLSDKVLDRSCLINFIPPEKFSNQISHSSSESSSSSALQRNVWESWKRTHPLEKKNINDCLNEVQKAMELLGKPFGHRVRNAIYDYVANYPKIDNGEKYALADQFEMKLIPKLRGLETRQEGFDLIKDIIEQKLEDENLLKSFEQALDRDYFVWKR
jgi:myosin heavy subunit